MAQLAPFGLVTYLPSFMITAGKWVNSYQCSEVEVLKMFILEAENIILMKTLF